jgi:hypothetical protein
MSEQGCRANNFRPPWIQAALLTPFGKGLAVIPQIEFGGYHALVIGNNDYAHLPKLENAVQDARDVADVLERLYGFEVQTIENASRSDIIGALVKLRAKLFDPAVGVVGPGTRVIKKEFNSGRGDGAYT